MSGIEYHLEDCFFLISIHFFIQYYSFSLLYPLTLFSFSVRKGRKLGKGRYGEVNLIEYLPTRAFLLWKRIKLSLVSKKGVISQALEELPTIHTPFLVQHYAVLKTIDSCYLIMERCDYGSFRQLLQTRKTQFSDKVRSVQHTCYLNALLLILYVYFIF